MEKPGYSIISWILTLKFIYHLIFLLCLRAEFFLKKIYETQLLQYFIAEINTLANIFSVSRHEN